MENVKMTEEELKEQYKENIKDIISDINSMEYLKFLNNLMLSFKKKWGI